MLAVGLKSSKMKKYKQNRAAGAPKNRVYSCAKWGRAMGSENTPLFPADQQQEGYFREE